jgi:hypothetical protein
MDKQIYVLVILLFLKIVPIVIKIIDWIRDRTQSDPASIHCKDVG